MEGVFGFKSWFPNAPGLIHGGGLLLEFYCIKLTKTKYRQESKSKVYQSYKTYTGVLQQQIIEQK